MSNLDGLLPVPRLKRFIGQQGLENHYDVLENSSRATRQAARSPAVHRKSFGDVADSHAGHHNPYPVKIVLGSFEPFVEVADPLDASPPLQYGGDEDMTLPQQGHHIVTLRILPLRFDVEPTVDHLICFINEC